MITSYANALSQLTEWESVVKELEKMEGQSLSEITKRTTLKKMLPTDLIRDLERDRSLKNFKGAWNFVLEQIPSRKEWTKAIKKNKDEMDVDTAEETRHQ